MSTTTIAATDGSGSFSAYIAMPKDLPAPAIILIQEIFGVNGDMRAKCDAFAAQGYIAICPDLFWRQEPGVDITDKSQAEWDKAMSLLNGFNTDKGIDDLKATLDAVRAFDDCNGKVGTVGYCLGGKLAYLFAARSTVDCAVGYYGIQLDTFMNEASGIKNPLMLHMAELDKFFPEDARKKVLAHFENFSNITAYVYPGVDHAFARLNGEHYDEAAATLANQRTDAFFANVLKG
ncbi:MAG TPA: dienelactone hydrolase family protein [Alphaproteobacteria bacterium]